MTKPAAAASNSGGAPEPPEPPEPVEPSSGSPKAIKNNGGASEGATSGRASPVRRKRVIDPSSPEHAEVHSSAKKAKTEVPIFVYNRECTTAEALGAEYRENSLTKYKFWYIPAHVSDLNRKMLLREFGSKKRDTPFPAQPSSSAQTPDQPFLEPSQMSPALATIIECNRALMTQFSALTEKLVAQSN